MLLLTNCSDVGTFPPNKHDATRALDKFIKIQSVPAPTSWVVFIRAIHRYRLRHLTTKAGFVSLEVRVVGSPQPLGGLRG